RLARQDGPWYYEQHELGFNYRITDLQCALGLSQMSKLSSFVERRRELVGLYADLMADMAGQVDVLTESPGRRSSYHLLVARLQGGEQQRRQVFDFLQANGIKAQVHYIPVHTQPWYREHLGYSEGDFPVAEKYYSGCITLPLFPQMSDGDVERVVSVLKRSLEQ
ncbi:MAG: DegT/DnrJ/EryC1/StrS family aminotransferase, partial [Blastocatellia bacterium]